METLPPKTLKKWYYTRF